MRVLLDTHLLLWAANGDPRMPAKAFEVVVDPESSLVFSAASIAEIAIKAALGRSGFVLSPRAFRNRLVSSGYEDLPISSDHALQLESLPDIHKDPFDRLLIAQAICDGLILLTADAVVASYPGPIIRV